MSTTITLKSKSNWSPTRMLNTTFLWDTLFYYVWTNQRHLIIS